MVIVILIVLGLCLGSFVNALVWRFHEKELLLAASEDRASKTAKKPSAKAIAAHKAELDRLSVATGRSMCVHCKHELAAKDLIPVVSYLMLRGKCRYCGKPIDDTPLPELVTPLLFVVSYLWWPMTFTGAGIFTFVMWLVFVVAFVALSLYDLKWFELPHRIVLPLIGLALVQVAIVAVAYDGGVDSVLHAVWGAVIGGGIFYGLYKLSPKQTLDDGTTISKWIGGGDITLGTLLGLLVGGPANALLLIFIASLLGTLLALPMLITGRATRTTQLPFGPFLMTAAVIVMLFGESLTTWYLGNFGL